MITANTVLTALGVLTIGAVAGYLARRLSRDNVVEHEGATETSPLIRDPQPVPPPVVITPEQHPMHDTQQFAWPDALDAEGVGRRRPETVEKVADDYRPPLCGGLLSWPSQQAQTEQAGERS